MKRSRRLLAALCAAVLLLSCILAGTAAADEIEIYQVAENDKMVDLPVDAMPAWIGGIIYVPYLVFDRSVTLVNLGVSYGLSRTDSEYKLSLYSLSGTLVFDLNDGTCVDSLTGENLDMKAVLRNGRPFVPLAAVCRYFGLSYTYTPTIYGTLIRITNGQERMNTNQFVDAATASTSSAMRSRYYNYLAQLNPGSSASPTPSAALPSTSTVPTQPSEDPEETGGDITLAFVCPPAEGLDTLLDTLESAGIRALFLFQAEDVSLYADEIRRIVGSGHAVGLTAAGRSPDELLPALEAGSAQLEQAAHLRTHTLYAPDASHSAIRQLEQAGWACWSPDLDARPDGRSQSSQASALLRRLDSREGQTSLLLDGSADSAGILSRILPSLQRDGFRFHLAVETQF